MDRNRWASTAAKVVLATLGVIAIGLTLGAISALSGVGQ
jgi:hypothetical protein